MLSRQDEALILKIKLQKLKQTKVFGPQDHLMIIQRVENVRFVLSFVILTFKLANCNFAVSGKCVSF